MKDVIDSMRMSDKVNYLLDTCFLVNLFTKNHQNKLIGFCNTHSVGMSSFNLEELNHIHHKFKGNENHHIRKFLKQNLISKIPINISPGNYEIEKGYVASFDPEILNLIPDASDAVMFVHALKIGANILTKDRHHVFTAAANNYSDNYNIKVFKDFPV